MAIILGRETGKKRDFIYRTNFQCNWPVFYAVSSVEPIDHDAIWTIDKNVYQPKIQNGADLYFMLRVNPRICRRNQEGKAVYFDIIQDAFHQYNLKKDENRRKAEIIQEHGEAWLRTRSEKHGFVVKSVIADNFQKQQFNKLKHAHTIRFSTLDYRGSLQVVDKERFLNALMRGIGAAKGFGCGLLMVKR